MQDPPKNAKNATFEYHRTTLSGYIFTTKAHIDNQKTSSSAIAEGLCDALSQF